jgi:hypothetical protein
LSLLSVELIFRYGNQAEVRRERVAPKGNRRGFFHVCVAREFVQLKSEKSLMGKKKCRISDSGKWFYADPLT